MPATTRSGCARTSAGLRCRSLSAGSSGNISVRLAEGWLITPTNGSLGRLLPERLSRLDADGQHVSGDAPSKEVVLHHAMYAGRSAARAIVHLHSTYSAAISCMSGLDCEDCIPPLTAYYVMKVGRLPLIPNLRPGDPRLAEAVRSHACRRCAVLHANHGPIVDGRSPNEAVNAVEELEATAKLFLLLRGTPARPLHANAIAELKQAFGSAGQAG